MENQNSPNFRFDGESKVIVDGITKKNWENKDFIDTIIKYVCALLNTVGNVRNIFFECKPNMHLLTSNDIDQFKQKIENKIKDVIGPIVLYRCIRVHDVNNEKPTGFTFEAQHCRDFCSVKHNLFLPASSMLIALTSPSFANIVEIMLNDLDRENVLEIEKEETFTKGERFRENESEQIQFKCFKENEKYNIVHKIQNSHLSHYISAFANHKGGRVYYGVEDIYNKIEGQRVPNQNAVTNAVEHIILHQMKWGKPESGDPKKGKDWDVQYIPVYEENGVIENRFVVVVSIRYFPNGVFSLPPVSYKWGPVGSGGPVGSEGSVGSEGPVSIKYKEWRDRVQVSVECYHRHMNIDVFDQSARRKCFDIINEVDSLIDSGEPSPSEVLNLLQKKVDNQNLCSPEFVTCYLQSAYQCYRIGNDKAAKLEMERAEKLLKSLKKNRPVLELHYFCLKASMARRRGELDKSLRLTYDCLAETDAILPGWETAMVWKTHGNTLAEMAAREEDVYRREKRRRNAEHAWCKAIEHAQKVVVTRSIKPEEKKQQYTLMNIIQLCHLYNALLHLGLSPSGKVLECEKDINVVTEKLEAVLVTRQRGYPFSRRTQCLFFAVLSLLDEENARKYGKEFLKCSGLVKVEEKKISIEKLFAREARVAAKRFNFTNIIPLANAVRILQRSSSSD